MATVATQREEVCWSSAGRTCAGDLRPHTPGKAAVLGGRKNLLCLLLLRPIQIGLVSLEQNLCQTIRSRPTTGPVREIKQAFHGVDEEMDGVTRRLGKPKYAFPALA
eukprot:CAMPEP_0181399028 /NCGR_PEP_ID=MMETSP1110-20121109/1366_1 /TAXON_ID=174948 /ORGANISM="Symbiodinium sp., Strain CCMP421" /LENGTH=106 /DNA_ID=CAMNT_0023521039 /DNA_START=199 /DNA_END=519 /DNA_ORIENTATION=+